MCGAYVDRPSRTRVLDYSTLTLQPQSQIGEASRTRSQDGGTAVAAASRVNATPVAPVSNPEPSPSDRRLAKYPPNPPPPGSRASNVRANQNRAACRIGSSPVACHIRLKRCASPALPWHSQASQASGARSAADRAGRRSTTRYAPALSAIRRRCRSRGAPPRHPAPHVPHPRRSDRPGAQNADWAAAVRPYYATSHRRGVDCDLAQPLHHPLQALACARCG
jgi:hypothetical protein